MRMSYKDEVERIAPKGTSRLVFKTDNNMVLNWKNGKIYVSSENPPEHRNHPLWWGGVEVADVFLYAHDTLTLVGIEVDGIVFEQYSQDRWAMNWRIGVGEPIDEDEDGDSLNEHLLYYWHELTSAPRMSQSSNLTCLISDERVLDNILGMFYNSKCGYYATLQKLVDYYGNNHFGIHILDQRLNTLRKGYDAVVRENRTVSWDGINFIIGGKK